MSVYNSLVSTQTSPSPALVPSAVENLPEAKDAPRSQTEQKTTEVAQVPLQNIPAPSSSGLGSRFVRWIRNFMASAKDVLITAFCCRCCCRKQPKHIHPPAVQGTNTTTRKPASPAPLSKSKTLPIPPKPVQPGPMVPLVPTLTEFKKQTQSSLDKINKELEKLSKSKVFQEKPTGTEQAKILAEENPKKTDSLDGMGSSSATEATVQTQKTTFSNEVYSKFAAHYTALVTLYNKQQECSASMQKQKLEIEKNKKSCQDYKSKAEAYKQSLEEQSKPLPASYKKNLQAIHTKLENLTKEFSEVEDSFKHSQTLLQQQWDDLVGELHVHGQDILKDFNASYAQLKQNLFQENSPAPTAEDLTKIDLCSKFYGTPIYDISELIKNSNEPNPAPRKSQTLHSMIEKLLKIPEQNEASPTEQELLLFQLKKRFAHLPMTLQGFTIPKIDTEPTAEVRGIPNPGNNCYLNASWQLLFNYPPFRTALVTTLQKTFENNAEHGANASGIKEILAEQAKPVQNKTNKNYILLALANMVYAYDHQGDLGQAAESLKEALFYGHATPELQIGHFNRQQTADAILSLLSQDFLDLGFHTQTRGVKATGESNLHEEKAFQNAWTIPFGNENASMQELFEQSFLNGEAEDNGLLEKVKGLKISVYGAKREAQLQFAGKKVRVDDLIIRFREPSSGNENSLVTFELTKTDLQGKTKTYVVEANGANKTLLINGQLRRPHNPANKEILVRSEEMEFVYHFTDKKIILLGQDVQAGLHNCYRNARGLVTIGHLANRKSQVYVHARMDENGINLHEDEGILFDGKPISLKKSHVQLGETEIPHSQQTSSVFTSVPDSLVLFVNRFRRVNETQTEKIDTAIPIDNLGITLFPDRHVIPSSTPVSTQDIAEGTGDINGPAPEQQAAPSCHPQFYRLTGFVLHAGTQEGGHYTAFIKRGDQWYHMDDSTVTPCTENDAKKYSKYLYFGTFLPSADNPIQEIPIENENENPSRSCVIL